MAIVLLSGDLTVISRVEGAARNWNTPVRAVASDVQLALSCNQDCPHLLIIDLTTPSIDVQKLMGTMPKPHEKLPIVAFGPHVHEEKLAAARQAGCHEVVSRGQFFSQLDSILARYLAK